DATATVDAENADVTTQTWSPCDAGTEVAWTQVQGANHAWMGHPAPSGVESRGGGPVYDGLDATPAIWSFLAPPHPPPPIPASPAPDRSGRLPVIRGRASEVVLGRHSPCGDRVEQRPVVLLVGVGVGGREGRERAIEPLRAPQVAGELHGVARARVGPRQRPG